MTVFVAVTGLDGTATPALPALPAPCIAALRLPGARAPQRQEAAGFACAGAPTRSADGAICAAQGFIAAGDVRLDDRVTLLRALRASEAAAFPGLTLGDGSPGPDDLALVLAAHVAWGDDAVERLRGDFSFVIWNAARRSLIAARDGLGVRPLYYARLPGGLCLSNVVDAVRAHPAVPASLHAPAIVSFLEHGWNRDTAATTFAGIARLPPGAMLRHATGRLQAAVSTHWRMPDPPLLRYRRDEEYVEHYRALLDAAVGDRLATCTAILLSGGLDSPSIAVTARRIAPEACLSAVTMRLPQVESPEEARLAAAVAARAGINHRVHEGVIAPFAAGLRPTPEPHGVADQPPGPSMLSSLDHEPEAVIQGEDGDALFAPPGLRAMLRRAPAAEVVRRVLTYTLRHRRHPYMGFWLARRLRFWRRPEASSRPPWLAPGAGPAAEDPGAVPHGGRPEASRALGASIWQSVHQGTDRAYHGAPVEYRWPLLDTRLIEFVFAIPPVPWCQRKFLVRRAYAGDLPREVVVRPKSTVPGYFDFAVHEWRHRTGGGFAPLHELTAEFVDARRLGETFRSGGTEEVLAGWRALVLDDWLRRRDGAEFDRPPR